MLKSFGILLSIFLVTVTTGCSPKASDSDVGRVKQADGFKVKSFVTVKISPVDHETARMVKSQMEIREIREREMVEINGVKNTKYYSSGYEEMVKVTRKGGKTTEITLEGLEGFTDTITDNIENKSIINSITLANAKKTFSVDMKKAVQIVKAYVVEKGVDYDSSSTVNDTKTTEYISGTKRIVLKVSPDYIIVIIEGKDDLVKPLRAQLAGLN